MPHVVIVTLGSRGDVQPYLALARGLVGAGLDVSIATHDRFAEAVGKVGAGFRSMPGDPVAILETPEGAEWLATGRGPVATARGLAARAEPLAGPYLEACVAAVAGADLVLFAPLAVGAHHAAEAAGIPAAGAWLQPLTATAHHPHVLAARFRPPRWANLATHAVADQLMWRVVAHQDATWRRSLGLDPLPFAGPYGLVVSGGVPVLYGMSPTLVPRPSDWPPTVHVTGAWFLPGPPLEDELEGFLAAGPAPFVVGFGSHVGPGPLHVVPTAVEAARRSGARVVVLAGWGVREAVGGDDGDVLVVPEAPHDRLLGRTAGILHHGGAGTSHAGARAGIPSLVAATFADRFFWAERLEALGAGLRLRRLDRSTVELAVARAIHQPWPGARRVAASMAHEDGVATAVRLVEAWLGGSVPFGAAAD
ncbi:MAG: glycosyltransferase [Acidimicrobiia bacterium]